MNADLPPEFIAYFERAHSPIYSPDVTFAVDYKQPLVCSRGDTVQMEVPADFWSVVRFEVRTPVGTQFYFVAPGQKKVVYGG